MEPNDFHFLDDKDLLYPSTESKNSTESTKNGKQIKILSFDGGGARCIFSLKILEILFKRLYGSQGPSERSSVKQFINNFDLIAGTSGGSIIASLLCMERSIDEIRKIFYGLNSKIFDKSWSGYPSKLVSYYKSGDFYNSDLLLQILSNFFEDKNMSSVPHHLMIITTNCTSDLFEPYIFRSYKANSKLKGSNDELLRNCIRASTAAPTYFSPFIDKNKNKFVDGGLVANNPTNLAILESKELFYSGTLNLILSIGTGDMTPGKGSTTLKNLPGELLTLMTNSELIHHEVIEFLFDFSRDTNYFRFSPEGLGSVKLDTSDVVILKNGELETEKYMKKQENLILKLLKLVK